MDDDGIVLYVCVCDIQYHKPVRKRNNNKNKQTLTMMISKYRIYICEGGVDSLLDFPVFLTHTLTQTQT